MIFGVHSEEDQRLLTIVRELEQLSHRIADSEIESKEPAHMAAILWHAAALVGEGELWADPEVDESGQSDQ